MVGMSKRSIRSGLLGTMALACVLGIYWHYAGTGAHTPAPADKTVPVRVSTVERRRMAVVEHTVGRIIAVERRVGASPDRFERERSATDDRCAGALGERPRGGAMVAVSMRAHDRDELAVADRVAQRVEMLRQVGSGIDDRDFMLPEQVRLGAEISECRRIVREHASNSRLQLLKPGVRRVHGALNACGTGQAARAAAA